MIIPKTWRGVTVVVPKKTLKYKLKGGAIATADKTRDGKPIIKVWKERKGLLNSHILNHEFAHTQLHIYKPVITTHMQKWRREAEAEKYIHHKINHRTGDLPIKRAVYVIDVMLGDAPPKTREQLASHWGEAVKYYKSRSKDLGLSKSEIAQACKYIQKRGIIK